MTEPRQKRDGHPTRLAAMLAVGVVAGAVSVGGLEAVHPFGQTQKASTAGAVSVTTTDVARTAAQYDAETIYKRDSPGVVDITVTQAGSQGAGISPFGPGGGGSAKAEGSGFVYDQNGDIVTAAHVVDGATAISVRFKDGTTAKATLVGADASSDTAVIKVGASAAQLTPLALADSSAVLPGEGVVAIGSPFGYEQSITGGIVSAVDRDIQAPNGYSIPNTIQTDAAINHGNSGGPLIDASGKVVGINVQIAADDQSTTSQNAGVGFAVPSDTVRAVVTDLIAGKTVQHAYLGVSVGDSSDGTGAQIGVVRPAGPAAAAGLKTGDVVTAVDGREITTSNQLTAAIAGHSPGDKLKLSVTRGGSELTVTVTLGTRPATTTA
jgi:putative serine protease PepD